MSNEADKVINLSLCKMAESRTTRRGGSSLHKHLLIASVLTKATRARSAFLDTWYIGDDASEGNVDLNMSYQEADFPTDELDSTVGESSELLVDPSEGDSSKNAGASTRYVSEVESDIDLPPDILSCVEKIGDLNNRMFSQPQPSASLSEASATVGPDCTTNAHPDLVSNAHPAVSPVSDDNPEDAQLSTTLTYLDLDAGSPTIVERGPAATSTPTKRRREWCFEDEEEDDQILGNGSYCIETPAKPQSNTPFGKKCKRLRFDDDDSGVASPEKSMSDETGVPSRRAENNSENGFKAGSFRLTYEDVDTEDSDDDSFLEDALNESLQTPSHIQLAKTRDRNDRRVPSGSSSSGSCSDEEVDAENSMEVDQITNLVQFISFNKQQQSQAQNNNNNMRSISCVN